MADDRLFDLDGIPEVPIFREPRRAKAARGVALDSRFQNDYPPEWDRCTTCGGYGHLFGEPYVSYVEVGEREQVELVWDLEGTILTKFANGRQHAIRESQDSRNVGTLVGIRRREVRCPDCLGMGSLKARVRLEADHRCERCLHPYMPKGDAKMLDVAPSPFQWSPCDERCTHGGSLRYKAREGGDWEFYDDPTRGWPLGGTEEIRGQARDFVHRFATTEAEWRILTVHHLSGDKSDCRWGNLCALCQRCHLEVQAKVVLERVYPFEHSEWFRPHAAWWYALSYLGESLERGEVMERIDELLALERTA